MLIHERAEQRSMMLLFGNEQLHDLPDRCCVERPLRNVAPSAVGTDLLIARRAEKSRSSWRSCVVRQGQRVRTSFGQNSPVPCVILEVIEPDLQVDEHWGRLASGTS